MICSLLTSGPNSAEIRPRAITMIRWATLRHSPYLGRRVDDGKPVLCPLGDQTEYFGLGAEVDPPTRLVEQQDFRIGRQHLADDDLLLIAAGERTDGGRAAARLDLRDARSIH